MILILIYGNAGNDNYQFYNRKKNNKYQKILHNISLCILVFYTLTAFYDNMNKFRHIFYFISHESAVFLLAGLRHIICSNITSS